MSLTFSSYGKFYGGKFVFGPLYLEFAKNYKRVLSTHPLKQHNKNGSMNNKDAKKEKEHLVVKLIEYCAVQKSLRQFTCNNLTNVYTHTHTQRERITYVGNVFLETIFIAFKQLNWARCHFPIAITRTQGRHERNSSQTVSGSFSHSTESSFVCATR